MVLGRQSKLIATMKKLFLIVAAMFAVVSFSACSDDDDKDASIVGTWQHSREMGYEDDNGEEYEFDKICSDEYCCLIFDDGGTGRETYDGGSEKITYIINGKTLKIKYGDDDGWAEFTIKELTETSLVLYEHIEREEDGKPYTASYTNYYTRK